MSTARLKIPNFLALLAAVLLAGTALEGHARASFDTAHVPEAESTLVTGL